MSPPPPSIPQLHAAYSHRHQPNSSTTSLGVLWTAHDVFRSSCLRSCALPVARARLEGGPEALPRTRARRPRRPLGQRRARGAHDGAADERLAHRRNRVADATTSIAAAHSTSSHLCLGRHRILVSGLLTRYLDSVSHADFDFVPALLRTVLLWDFLTRVMQQITMDDLRGRLDHNFLDLFASPLSTSEYLGLLTVTIITSG